MEAITKEGTQNEVHVTDMRSVIDPVTLFGKPAFSADWYGLLIAGGKMIFSKDENQGVSPQPWQPAQHHQGSGVSKAE